jgi:hypothetical protein
MLVKEIFHMAQTKKFEVRCMHEDCREWFPTPLYLGNSETFDTSILFQNTTNCPHCGRDTGCDKENFRVLFEDGGFVGDKTTGTGE